MSTTAAPTTGGGGSSFFPQNLSHIGLGFFIAVALAFLVLLSTVVLASYVCCRARRNTVNPSSNRNNPSNAIDTAAHPRILFVAEEDNAEEESSVVGLAQNVINSYPKFDFSRSKDRISPDTVCSICLCDYKDGEMLRMMPDCRHFFHLVCVDSWLRLNASCPICRTSPLPTPLSTPLSELVPLSHYPVTGRRS